MLAGHAQRDHPIIERPPVRKRRQRVAIGQVAVLGGQSCVTPGNVARFRYSRLQALVGHRAYRGAHRGQRADEAGVQLHDRRRGILRWPLEETLDRVEQGRGVRHPRVGRVAPPDRHAVATEHDPGRRARAVDRDDCARETGGIARLGRAQSDDRRHMLAHECVQRMRGDVRAEVQHVIAGASEHVRDHLEPEHVHLSFNAREHDSLA